MFDETLGKYTGSDYTMKLKEGTKPYHSKPFPFPKFHKPLLKKVFDRPIKIGVFKIINNSQLAALTFMIPKINGTVSLISDFRELNNRVKGNLFQFLNIQDLLLLNITHPYI